MTAPSVVPGRGMPTLDERIAVEVFGWQKYRVAAYPPQSAQAAAMCWHRPGIYAPCALPPFSTDIAAAWLVVEKMRAGGEFEMNATHHAHNGMTWCAWFGSVDAPTGFGETAPLAICRAALLTVANSGVPSSVVLAVDLSRSSPDAAAVAPPAVPSRDAGGADR